MSCCPGRRRRDLGLGNKINHNLGHPGFRRLYLFPVCHFCVRIMPDKLNFKRGVVAEY